MGNFTSCTSIRNKKQSQTSSDISESKLNDPLPIIIQNQNDSTHLTPQRHSLLVYGYIRYILSLSHNMYSSIPKDVEELCRKFSKVNFSSFSAKNIRILETNKYDKIGAINLYDDNIIMDIIFKTPNKKKILYAYGPFYDSNMILIGNTSNNKERIISVSIKWDITSFKKSYFIVKIDGMPYVNNQNDHPKFTFNTKYHLKIDYKKNKYFKLICNGKTFISWNNNIPQISSHVLNLPISVLLADDSLTRLGDNVPDGVIYGVIYQYVNIKSFENFNE